MTDATKKIEDLTDDELASLGDDQIAAMIAASNTAAAADANAGATGKTDAEKAAEEEARQAEEAAAAAAAQAAAAKDDADDKSDDAAESKGDDVEAGKAAAAATPAADKGTKADDKGEKVDAGKAKAAPAAAQTGAVDYEAEHKKLLAPFKANGRDITVASVDEARQLMQMGANYNKKMEGMKPHLTTIRTLENAGIKAEELSFLIDLHRRDPAAINKLVQDSKIDPMDLSAEKAAGYTPGNHRATDAEVELDTVLADLQGSAGFERMIDVVTKKMDPRSKQAVAENPNVLRVISGHMENGIYDLIQSEIDKRRMLGNLKGLPDLEAYRQVGDELNASGKFAHILAGQPAGGQQAPAAPVVSAPNPKKADDSKRNEQKRGVAPAPAKAASGKAKPDFNPLSMSDEDILKHDGKF